VPCCCSRHKSKNKPAITNISDKLWNILSSTLPSEKPNNTVGRPIVPFRKVLNGILYVLRTGCQWKMLSKEYGSGSTCHRRFQQWVQLGIFKKIWMRLLKEYDHKIGIKWIWQSLDGISIKSPLVGAMTGTSPVDRSKLGQAKRHILTDKNGIHLSTIITPANTRDIKVVTKMLSIMQ
jgi:putative transposase